jgi:serine/threonine protein kinase
VVPDLDHQGLDLLRQMLVYHPQQRITARQARLHPWFDEFRNPQQHMMYYQ